MKHFFLAFALCLFFLNCSKDESVNNPKPQNLGIANLTNTTVDLTWNSTIQSSLYEAEYGTIGFSLGTGTKLTVPGQYAHVENLQPLTSYAFYARVFNNEINEFSNWAGPYNFVTLEDNPYCDNLSFFVHDDITYNSVELRWGNSSFDGWEVEYGLTGFMQGTGSLEVSNATSNNDQTTINNLDSNTSYDFYTRKKCSDIGFSSWEGPLTVLTDEEPFNLDCNDPSNFEFTGSGVDFSGTVNIRYIRFNWDANGEDLWEIHYVPAGQAIGSSPYYQSTTFNNVQFNNLNGLSVGQVYDFYVRADCGPDGNSGWVGPVAVTAP